MESRRFESYLRHGINGIQRVAVGTGKREDTRMTCRCLAYMHDGWHTIRKNISSISCLRTLRLREVKWPTQGCVPSKRHSQVGLQFSRWLPFQLHQATSCVWGAMGIAVLGNEVPGLLVSQHIRRKVISWMVYFGPQILQYLFCYQTKHLQQAFVALRLPWLTYQYLWKVQLTWFQPFCVLASESDDKCRSVKGEKIYSLRWTIDLY